MLVCVLAFPAFASAERFEVNSTGDEIDAIPGNEFCLTADGGCTLRAAIEESNALEEGEDEIYFDREVFDGGSGGAISLGSTLPTIEGVVSIIGECVLVADFVQPCVGVDGPNASDPALIVKDTSNVKIVGLAITGAETGIEVIGTPKFKALSVWLGVKLDGSAAGNGTGILLGPGSNDSQIGNEGETNVFAHNTGDGLEIHGASGARVMGGYFGVGPDGETPAPNGGKGIEVVSFEGLTTGTTIGTQLSPEAAATPACDGGCNVISGAGESGVDLEGDGGEELSAATTTIIGNYIGLDASGTAAIPNAFDAIQVGQAARTTIGGPRDTEVNRFAGGNTAISAGPSANDLVVRGNSIGIGTDGGSLVAPDAGIVINSVGLSGPAVEAVVAGNEVRMGGGVAIALEGFGGWIVGNEIAGAGTGISTLDPTEEHGNLIEDNLIEGSTFDGILVESSFNEIFGNEVVGSGGSGIRLEGASSLFGFGVSGNVVGGNADADENLIAGSGGAAIEISNLENTNNEVARNWGLANDGLFIDLVPAVPATEKKGPNKGIKPPTIVAAKSTAVSGFGAVPGARIRVFRKASSEAGEIEAFLGEAIADEEGGWDVVYGAPVPAATIVAATQTARGSGTSELATATSTADPVKPKRPAPPACPAAGPAKCPVTPPPPPPTPQTKITKGPKAKSHSTTAKFRFSSSVKGSSFQCKLDKAKFKPCRSPKKYKGLKRGRHVFKVRAVNSAGVADPTPAKRAFKILP
ncbi:MAG: right-handed parallel beta-helix repeat-containing protein [Solirubrobacterales bacterium]